MFEVKSAPVSGLRGNHLTIHVSAVVTEGDASQFDNWQLIRRQDWKMALTANFYALSCIAIQFNGLSQGCFILIKYV